MCCCKYQALISVGVAIASWPLGEGEGTPVGGGVGLALRLMVTCSIETCSLLHSPLLQPLYKQTIICDYFLMIDIIVVENLTPSFLSLVQLWIVLGQLSYQAPGCSSRSGRENSGSSFLLVSSILPGLIWYIFNY